MRAMPDRRPRDRRVAHPDDFDLIVDYRGVALGAILVYGRSIYVEHTLDEGWVGAGVDRRPVPAGATDRWFEAAVSYQSLDEAQFTVLVQQLEQWAADGTRLHYVAAPRRLSALYDPTGAFLPLPGVTVGDPVG